MNKVTIYDLTPDQVDVVIAAIRPYVRGYEVEADSGSVTYVTVG